METLSFQARDPKNPSKFLDPLRHQNKFAFSRAYNTLLAGGWGAGKSLGLINFAMVSMACNPGTMIGIIEPTYKLLRNFIFGKFVPAFKPYIRGYSMQDNLIFMDRGVSVVYLSGHDVSMLEQYELSTLLADEVGRMSRELLMYAAGRVRESRARRRRIGFAGTPEYGWMSEFFKGRNDENRRILHVSTRDNPYLPADYEQNLLASCPAHLRRAKIEGYFVPPGGSVYPEIDAEKHLVDWNPRHHRGLVSVVLFDWSPRRPHILFAQLLPVGFQIRPGVYLPPLPFAKPEDKFAGAVIYDELIPDGQFQSIRTDRLVNSAMGTGNLIDYAIVDKAGVADEATSGTNQIAIAERMLRSRCKYATADHLVSIVNGVQTVQALLEPSIGVPRLYFARPLAATHNPRGVWPAMQSFSYPKDKEGKPLSNLPDKDGIADHACDLVRYLAINELPNRRIAVRITEAA